MYGEPQDASKSDWLGTQLNELADDALIGDDAGRCYANVDGPTDFCRLGADHQAVCVGSRDYAAYVEYKLDELTTTLRVASSDVITPVQVAAMIEEIRYPADPAKRRVAVARWRARQLEDFRRKQAEKRERFGEYAEPYGLMQMFNQSSYWLARGGIRVELDTMEPSYRYNTAIFLLNRVRRFAQAYAWQVSSTVIVGAGMNEPPDEVVDSAMQQAFDAEADPLAWLLETKLFRALRRSVAKPQRVLIDAHAEFIRANGLPAKETTR